MLSVSGIRKSFKQFEAVRGVSFTVRKGEAFGLLGPNGAGKSTTINMLTGLFPPSEGSIMLSGIDLKADPKKAQALIGIVPQEIALYQTMSAKDNLYFWGRMYGLSGSLLNQRVAETLELIGLADRAKDKVETFSGGMKRRVNIGAAILHRPELLIMDEPTVGIDPQSRAHILDTVKRLNSEGMTVIYTSHYMEEVEFLCERIGIMDHGKLIASGTIPELREKIGDRSKMVFSIQGGEINPEILIGIVQAGDCKVSGDQLTVFHKEPQAVLSTLVQRITENGAQIAGVEIVEPNLESVFLHLTGRSLRD
ncbi:export ABC transporter ATP-binding protein [Neobacillus piezotolerans]|uniref:Export ABC transporter ATP-binding protein n=1 Tax=Neobacillus piezotolerans TaxID=2259171 RepID=A0A3D8GY24_9BACI|nr:ABC transporter ATP-binding protein [Neobacillus piezotolerans]RDU38956.1 export ABC transporter ATP-binding protein [Neobacillus piezotolerans]